MNSFLFASAGMFLFRLAETVGSLLRLAISVIIGGIIVLLVIRWLIDVAQINPFGKVVYYLRRPTDGLLSYAHNSRFYYSLRQALKFNPAILIAIVSMAIIWYVSLMLVGNLTMILGDWAMCLDAFSGGKTLAGIQYLVGSLLMVVIYGLMLMMTVIFVNWISGLFAGWSFRAERRLAPLLRFFEFGGTYAGWAFLILWLTLYLASIIVQNSFF